MKNILLTIILTITFGLNAFSQSSISCNELADGVAKEGKKVGGYSTLDLFNSDWLYKVDGYEYEEFIFVIAEVKRKNSLLQQTDKYIFCGIPKSNWENFSSKLSDWGMSIGEKFHKYIYNYKCNCD